MHFLRKGVCWFAAYLILLIVQIYEILNKILKSRQELNNKIRTRDVNLVIIYMKMTVEILNVVGIGMGDKKTE